jgi:DNA-binding MarR family transcriptional regulator
MSTSQSQLGSIPLLIRLTRAVYKRATDEVLGMKLKGYMTLSSLRDRGEMPQSELCIAMHLDPNNCVILLNHLEAEGWIERRRDPADRRRHIVVLTSEGREALTRAERAMGSLEAEVFGALSPDERQVLHDLLTRALAEEPVVV